MTQFYPNFSIRADWFDDRLTPSEMAVRIEAMLRRLEPLSRAMSNWLLADEDKYVSVLESKASIPSILEHTLEWLHDDDPDPAYTALIKGSEEPSEFGTAESVHISVTVGGRSNDFDFEIGGLQFPTDPDLITYPVYRGALEVLASIWPCPWAAAKVFVPDGPLADRDADAEPNSVFEAAWIGYLSAPLAAGLRPPPEIVAEPTPGGGVVLSAVPERIDPSNPDHMRRSRMLEAIMLERVGLAPPPLRRLALHAAREGPY
jgi:hypothetical protein